MRNVVLMVKNGIGFGHIRRALLLAKALAASGRCRPIVISQATSLAMYDTADVPVVNFPLLDRVPSDVTEDCYVEILEELLRQLDPAVVVEDTYPDPRYTALSSLREVPRVLVMRRLDGASFDTLRQAGRFAPFDDVVILQTPEEFAAEGHSGSSLMAARSPAVSFVGNISAIPTQADVERARATWSPDGAPLVVVAAGAGGDQMPDGYGDRLFSSCASIAGALYDDGHSARFVLVTGPYYAGRPLPEGPNLSVRQFLPDLAALLGTAHVAVLKPGNNGVSEALLGGANLVLVPDVSFMEGLEQRSARVVENYGGTVCDPEQGQLDHAIRHALDQPLRQQRAAPNTAGMADTVARILAHLDAPARPIARKQVALVLDHPDLSPEHLASILPAPLTPAAIMGRDVAWLSRAPVRDGPPVAFADTVEPATTPQALADSGVHLLLTTATGPSPGIDRWLRLAPATPSLVTTHAYGVRARTCGAAALARRLTHLLARTETTCVRLNLEGLDADNTQKYLQEFADWLAGQPTDVVSPVRLIPRHSDDLLRGTA